MNKFKELLNSYFFLIAIVFLVFIGWMSFSIHSTYRAGEFNQTVGTQTNQANTSVKQAQTAANTAANLDIERRTEDVIREKTITPKLENIRRRSEHSKAELHKARKTYNEKQNDTSNLSASNTDNCAKLQHLFPNVAFADCR